MILRKAVLVPAAAACIAILFARCSGCEDKKIVCSTDVDCPGGTCDPTINRCAFVACDDGGSCPSGTFCNPQMANLCTQIPDGGTNDCVPTCQPYQLCLNTQCQNRYANIVITQPQDGAFLDGGTAVAARLDVVSGFPRQDPNTLTLVLGLPDGGVSSSGVLANQLDGGYRGLLVPFGDGRYQLTARYDAANLSSSAISVTILTIPPSFIITVPPPARPSANYMDPDPAFAEAWRRDEIMLLSVGSTDQFVVPTSVTLTVKGISGATSSTTPVNLDAGCGQPYCGTVLVDMAQPDLKDFHGTFALIVRGTDRAGNVGTTNSGVPVTRWKWVFTTPDARPIKSCPAIGSSGTVYFGTTNGSTMGSLNAVNPDGTLKWPPVDAGSVFGSVAVGELDGGVELVYVAGNASNTIVHAINGGGGQEVAKCGPYTGSTHGSLAITKTVSGLSSFESCLAAINSGANGQMLAMRPGAAIAPCQDAGTGNPGGMLQEPAAVAVDATNNVYFTLMSSAKVQSLAFDGGWLPRTAQNWPASANANNVALALAGNVVVASGVGTRGGVFSLAMSDGGQTWSFPDPAHTAWNPSVADGGLVFYGDDGAKLTNITIGAGTVNAQVTTAGVSHGAPAVGQDRTIYTADSISEALFARDSLLNPLWSVSNLGGFFEGSIALDCTRDGTGASVAGRPGVLYAPDTANHLFCFVTDSRGIDTTSPWPKYQHDPRNTGNQQTPLSQFVCP